MTGVAQNQERTEQRREEVKARLRAAALELVETLPFSELKIEQITKAAGLSRSAFYFYYRDKRDLLREAATEAAADLYAQADRWWHGDGDPATLVTEALTGVARLWGRHATVLRLTVEVATYDAEVRRLWDELVGRFITATAEHLREEQEAGQIPAAINTEKAAAALIWQVERCLYALEVRDDEGADELVETLSELWVRALYGTSAAG